MAASNHFISLMDQSQPAPRTNPSRHRGNKPHFSEDDDIELERLVNQFGDTCHWKQIASSLSNGKFTGHQCRERYKIYLDPIYIEAPFTPAEDQLLINQVAVHGTRWATIMNAFQNRSAKSLKFRWITIQNAPVVAQPPPPPPPIQVHIPLHPID